MLSGNDRLRNEVFLMGNLTVYYFIMRAELLFNWVKNAKRVLSIVIVFKEII